MGGVLTAVLVDTHVVQWWTADRERLSAPARAALQKADDIAVSSITWLELAWLARDGRIEVTIPLHSWLTQLSGRVRTVAITPTIAATAALLPRDFPKDPADRLIYATAIELGLPLITRDEDMRRYKHSHQVVTVW